MGSSPLTRGKPLRVREARKHQGLIPAHAGKTPSSLARSVTSRAHPRSRGENATKSSSKPPGPGSSPLTRGKLGVRGANRVGGGLIPAHAGKTLGQVSSESRARAHPRSRGENDGGFAWKAGFPGSSPLTRGKQRIRPARLRGAGLIPAHAGKTRPPARSPSKTWAHPRSRGENNRDALRRKFQPGSSPLTRGKPGRRD